MRIMLWGAALFLGISVQAVTASDVCDNFEVTTLDAAKVASFRDDFIAALKEGDAKKVAAMVHYPISVRLHGKGKRQYKTAKQLAADFAVVFPKPVIDKIVAAPKADTVCRDQGVGLARGKVWIHAPDMEKLSEIRVIAINP